MTLKTLDDFVYCPTTGKLWKGGNLCKSDYVPYINTTYNGRTIRAHRLIWLIMTGEEADDMIDHKNRNKKDNRWCNLRKVTRAQNVHNSKIPSNNKAGVKGVRIDKRTGKFIAELSVTIGGYRQRYTKQCDTLEEAANERQRLVAKYRTGTTSRQ